MAQDLGTYVSQTIETATWLVGEAFNFATNTSNTIQEQAPAALVNLAEKVNVTKVLNEASHVFISNPLVHNITLGGLAGFLCFTGFKDLITNEKCSAIGNLILSSTMVFSACLLDNSREDLHILANSFVGGVAINIFATTLAILTTTVANCCCLNRKTRKLRFH